MSLTTAVAAQFKLILRKECMTSATKWTGGCVFHLSTAVLGYFLIFVVALVQIPLLFRILKYKENKTLIKPFSVGLMAFMASNNVAYAVNMNLPISTWGEGVVEIILYLSIINLLFIHQGHHRQAVAFTLIYVTVMVGSLTPVFPAKILMLLKLLNIPMDIFRKVTIMYQCHKHGVPVSPVSNRRSIALLNMCSLGRFLTACVHSQDVLLIVAYGQESLCTLALSTVAMVLRRRSRKRSAMKKKDKDGGSSSGSSLEGSLVDECLMEDYTSNSSGAEELAYGGDGDEDEEDRMRRRRKWRRKMRKILAEEEEGEDISGGSGMEDSGYFSELTRKRRKNRMRNRGGCGGGGGFPVEDLDGEMSSSYNSGLEEYVRSVERQRES